MTRIPRKRILIPVLFFIVTFIANFSWNQAALAWMISGQTCSVNLVQTATSRVNLMLNKATSNPVILCSPRYDFGMGIEYGETRIAPFLPAIIVLGPEGENVDVAAHEIAHARIAASVGALLRLRRIPIWFDEGLAMQFDARSDYSRVALKGYLRQSELHKPQLADLQHAGGFFARGKQGRLHYSFARCVVEEWLDANGASQPSQLLEEINWRSEFPSRDFQKHEQNCLLNS